MSPMKRKRSSTTHGTVLREIVQHGTKTGIAATLTSLNDAGLLVDGFYDSCNFNEARKDLGRAQAHHGDQTTPYGPVIQTMSLPCKLKWKALLLSSQLDP